ncbi:SETMR methyltransferase, partial [Acromyrmex heyeri]
HKRFLEGRETLEDDKKSGRPILVRTPEMIEKVRDFVANDRNTSLKMMEEALNISREMIRTILHEDLGKTKVCAKFVPHTLRSDQKSASIFGSKSCLCVKPSTVFT